VREKCKTIWSWDDVAKEIQETLWGFIKEHYIFPSEQEKIGKNATMKTISNALWRFRHALNKYYVQRGLSPLNRFGMGHIRIATYHSTSRSPQQQDERAECEE
jgi:hypothetical protein